MSGRYNRDVYLRWKLRRQGFEIPRAVKTSRPLSERLWSRVDKRGPDECWLWNGYKDRQGYGRIGVAKHKIEGAHRVAWEVTFGPIPKGLCVCHDCPDGDNPSCCNPNHLWLGDNDQNIQDMVIKGRQNRGRKHRSAKIDENAVSEIRFTKETLPVTNAALAKAWGISSNQVAYILSRKNWRHVA